MSDEHAAARLQQHAEAEQQATAVADSTCRIEELVRALELSVVDHRSRVADRSGLGAQPDATADMLAQIAELQAGGLPPPPGRPHFYAVAHGMVEQWIADLEELETALAAPCAPSPSPISGAQAQLVCEQLHAMWQEMEEASAAGLQLPFMQVLLLSKKLCCIDQLRPSDEEAEGRPPIPWQVLELRALLVRLAAHEQVWSYTLRWPFSYFETGRWKLTDRAASTYARAAWAAHPDVCQQARLLVEQCRVLEANGRLQEAQLQLDAFAWEYPEAPLQVLHALHTKYGSAAGPPLDRALLQLFDSRRAWSDRDWQSEWTVAEAHAAELEQQLLLDTAAGTSATGMTIAAQQHQAEQARAEADALAARPRSFASAMNRSLRFFHSDKRGVVGNAEADAEFAQVKEAWSQLSACRTFFQQLREYQTQMAAVAQS
jgi:hypothetical protein